MADNQIEIGGAIYTKIGNIKGPQGLNGPRGIGWIYGNGTPDSSTTQLPTVSHPEISYNNLNYRYFDLLSGKIYIYTTYTNEQGSTETGWKLEKSGQYILKGSKGDPGKICKMNITTNVDSNGALSFSFTPEAVNPPKINPISIYDADYLYANNYSTLTIKYSLQNTNSVSVTPKVTITGSYYQYKWTTPSGGGAPVQDKKPSVDINHTETLSAISANSNVSKTYDITNGVSGYSYNIDNIYITVIATTSDGLTAKSTYRIV